MDQSRYEFQAIGVWSLTYSGMLSYLKLKQYNKAKELATLGLIKGNSLKHNVIVGCHCVLGFISANNNDDNSENAQLNSNSNLKSHLIESSSHFMNAIESSLYSKLPMLELLTYRFWKESILENKKNDLVKQTNKQKKNKKNDKNSNDNNNADDNDNIENQKHKEAIERGLIDMEGMIEETCFKMGHRTSQDFKLILDVHNN